jgi:hypothetical protein
MPRERLFLRTLYYGADDKIVEDSEVLNVKFGQKVDEDMFRAG